MKRLAFAAVAALVVFGADAGVLTEKIAKDHKILGTDTFAGGERTRFEFEGCEAWVVEPPAGVQIAGDRPWTWTMQWATAFVSRTPVCHLLKRGWHHVTIITFEHKMDEKGLEISNKYQDYLVNELGLARKACLIGMSWGGFFSTRYARYSPGRVAAIYYDCPLMNFATFKHSAGPWDARVPGGDPKNWADSPEMPINMAGAIVSQDIPVYLLYGGVDAVVPPASNCELFIRQYRRLGGEDMKVVQRGAYAHHPHGLEESDTSIANFFEQAFRRPEKPAAPKFSVFSSRIKAVMKERNVDMKGAVKLLNEAGITGFDTSYTDPTIPEYQAAGLKLSNLFGWPLFNTNDLGRAQWTEFVDTAVKYGGKRIMVIPESFSKEADAAERERMTVNIVNGFRQLCEYAEQKGIIVMMEDYGASQNLCSNGKELGRVFASEPRIAYALDTGNFYYSGRGTDVVEFARQWKNRIAHVHLKDQTKEDPHSYCTLGTGAVPNAELLHLIKEIGYSGWLTLENPVGEGDRLDDIARQCNFVRGELAK